MICVLLGDNHRGLLMLRRKTGTELDAIYELWYDPPMSPIFAALKWYPLVPSDYHLRNLN